MEIVVTMLPRTRIHVAVRSPIVATVVHIDALHIIVPKQHQERQQEAEVNQLYNIDV